MDVGEDAAAGDGDGAEKLRELLVVPHRQLDVPRHYPPLLVVPRRVPRQLQHLHTPCHVSSGWCSNKCLGEEKKTKDDAAAKTDLCGEVLKDGGEVYGSSGADALGVLPGLEEARDAAHGELEPRLAAPRRRLLRHRGAPERLPPSGHGGRDNNDGKGREIEKKREGDEVFRVSNGEDDAKWMWESSNSLALAFRDSLVSRGKVVEFIGPLERVCFSFGQCRTSTQIAIRGRRVVYLMDG